MVAIFALKDASILCKSFNQHVRSEPYLSEDVGPKVFDYRCRVRQSLISSILFSCEQTLARRGIGGGIALGPSWGQLSPDPSSLSCVTGVIALLFVTFYSAGLAGWSGGSAGLLSAALYPNPTPCFQMFMSESLS